MWWHSRRDVDPQSLHLCSSLLATDARHFLYLPKFLVMKWREALVLPPLQLGFLSPATSFGRLSDAIFLARSGLFFFHSFRPARIASITSGDRGPIFMPRLLAQAFRDASKRLTSHSGEWGFFCPLWAMPEHFLEQYLAPEISSPLQIAHFPSSVTGFLFAVFLGTMPGWTTIKPSALA